VSSPRHLSLWQGINGLRTVRKSEAVRGQWSGSRRQQRWLHRLEDVARGWLGETPEQRYVRYWLGALDRGRLHSTLGAQVKDEAVTREQAKAWLNTLVAFGLRPEHICVEFGCGSLWCAEPVIRYLQPGRFVGLDITNRFFELGRVRLDGLDAEKQVRLMVASPEAIRAVSELEPDIAYSRKVLPHVAPDRLEAYLANACGLMGRRTKLVIENSLVARSGPTEKMLWAYALSDIKRYLPPDIRCEQTDVALVVQRI
jgi:hypothetical protein